MKKVIFISVVLYCAGCMLCTQTEQERRIPRVEIPDTQMLTMFSSAVGQEYQLFIQLPRNYQDTSKRFPVLFVLDAQWDFTLMSALYGQQYYDRFIPSIIIVGITWGGISPNPDSLRVRDFTPVAVYESPQSGGAGKFQMYLKNELIPFIDARFRTVKNDRALAGSSLGGLFTLYTLFTETELFNRYILTSPALGWGRGAIYSFENEYVRKPANRTVKLFMAEGSLENGENEFDLFSKNLMKAKPEGLDVQCKILDGVGHSGGKAEGYTRGLQYVYRK